MDHSSSSEEDYMSDKILECAQDVRPSLLFNREIREHELHKKKLQTSKQIRIKDLEEAQRKSGLSTAIPKENKGFQMLQKMGFKSGEGLGKSRSGIVAPIPIEPKQGTSGVGAQTREQLLSKRKRKAEENLQKAESHFIKMKREKQMWFQLKNEFSKAQRICSYLDLENDVQGPEEPFFWTPAEFKKFKKLLKVTNDNRDVEMASTSAGPSGEGPSALIDTEGEVDEDNIDPYVTEENLSLILTYLRGRYNYCLYCGMTAVDEGELAALCPGPKREDHDE